MCRSILLHWKNKLIHLCWLNIFRVIIVIYLQTLCTLSHNVVFKFVNQSVLYKKNYKHVYISLFGCCNLCNSLKCYVVLNAIKVSAWTFKCS